MIAGTHVKQEREVILPCEPGTAPPRNEHERSTRPFQWIAWLRAAMERSAPLGYQDESGFHYGAEQ